jgi:protein arginine N-methyltransferase 1
MSEILREHIGYLTDAIKCQRYRSAIDRLVGPEHVVLDLGCGSGLLGLMALHAGARKVLFVEEGQVVDIARRAVTEAGFSERAEFFQANSFELDLPEQVDLVVCDHVGYFGFDYGVLALLADAQQRFLKPAGTLMPAEIQLQLAPVESAKCREFISEWKNEDIPDEFGWVASTAANTKHGVTLGSEDLLADAQPLATLETAAEAAPFLSWTVEFKCARAGLLDGVAGWFNCRLLDDIVMTNSPGASDRLDRPQAFLPLEQPVAVNAGDTVKATIMIRHLDSVIGWVIELPEQGEKFSHNTFNGLLLDREAIAQTSPTE